jgi:hypothetical protein
MSAGAKTPLKEAQAIAEALKQLLFPVCKQIEIAGSIRREKAEVGDGEIVAVPKIEDLNNLLHNRLDVMVASGVIEKAVITNVHGRTSHRWGDKYRAIVYQGIKFDIFMTDTDSWGYQFLLRTGPADANEYLVTRVKNSPAPFRLVGGDVFKGETRIPVRTEKEFMILCGLPEIDPSTRTLEAYKKLLGRGHKWGNPADVIPAPAPELRLLWRYKDDILAEFPIPLEFHDEESGLIWANLTTDRFCGQYVLVEKGSREARFQHEFMVGAVQRRFELERLRQWMWKDEKLPVPGYQDISALPETYFTYLPGSHKRETVPLDKIVPTQSAVYRWGVHIKAQTIQRQRDGLFNIPWEPASGIRFAGSDTVFLTDGHHRYMAAEDYNLASLDVDIADFALTFEQALQAVPDDDTDYISLADVMDEVYAILNEKVSA